MYGAGIAWPSFGHAHPFVFFEVRFDDPVLVRHHAFSRNLEFLWHLEYEVGLAMHPAGRPDDGLGQILVVAALRATVDPRGERVEFVVGQAAIVGEMAVTRIGLPGR